MIGGGEIRGRSGTTLTAAQRLRRLAAAGCVIVALVWGTFWGQDDHFPLGPFRMYSIRNELDGRIRAAQVRLENALGDTTVVPINPGSFGMRRAEVEGQVDRFRSNPQLLRHLAAAYEQREPGNDRIVSVELFYKVVRLAGGRPSGESEFETIATWTAP